MKLLVPLCATFLSSCATVPTTAAPTAGLGQTVVVGSVRVKPIAVVEDSRCPMNARCVWAGRLVLLAEVDFRGGSEQWRGNMVLGEPQTYGTETVTLVAATPDRVAGTAATPATYRFTFSSGR